MKVIPQAGEFLSNGRVPSSYIHILQTPLKGWQHSLPCELFCPSLTADAASNCFWIRSMIGCGLASIFLPRRWETSERKQVSARFVEQCVEKKKLLPWRKFEMASRSSKKSRSRAHKKCSKWHRERPWRFPFEWESSLKLYTTRLQLMQEWR